MECCCCWYYLGVLIAMLLGVIMCDELNDRFKRLPFGPIRVPILGNLLQLYYYDKRYTYKALTKLAAVHGSTMKVWFGFVGSVVLSGYDRIQAILRNDDWIGEQDDTWLLDRATKPKSVSITQKADAIRAWASAKLFTNQALRDLGFGQGTSLHSLFDKKTAELIELVQFWQGTRSENRVTMDNFFLPFIASMNWTLATGEQRTMQDSKVLDLVKLLTEWEECSVASSKYLDNWPRLREWAPEVSGCDRLGAVNRKIREFLQSLIAELKPAGDKHPKVPSTLVEKFLWKIGESSKLDDLKSSDVVFTEETLISVLFNILFPSTLVLQSTLNFALLYISQNEGVQNKIREETRRVADWQERQLTIDDVQHMPYLTAVILEVYRLANVVPMERRKILKTVREGDTRVTQGMTLIFNYDSVNHSKDMWEDPTTFKPERFLDSNGVVTNESRVLAVNAAKRLCIGELASRAVLKYTICALLQKFKFKFHSFTTSSDPQWGIINSPNSYRIQAE